MAEKTNDADRPDRLDLPRTEFESLHAFQRVMYDKLRANRHKGGWQEDPPRRLLERLRGELKELEAALSNLEASALREARARMVAEEAADVANFAMMIADVVGGLSYTRRD